MYRRGHQIAGVGCASLGAPCGSRLAAAGDWPLRFDLNRAIRNAAEGATGLEPAWWQRFWVAFVLAEQLDDWITNVKPGPFWTSTGVGTPGTVNTAYVDVIVDTNTAMRAINGIMAEAIDLGAVFVKGTRAATYLKDLEEIIAHIGRISSAMWEGVRSAHATALAVARQQAAARGADLDDKIIPNVLNAYKQLAQLGWERGGEPTVEAAKDLLDKAAKGAEQLVKSDTVKWGVAVAGIALVAYFALKK